MVICVYILGCFLLQIPAWYLFLQCLFECYVLGKPIGCRFLHGTCSYSVFFPTLSHPVCSHAKRLIVWKVVAGPAPIKRGGVNPVWILIHQHGLLGMELQQSLLSYGNILWILFMFMYYAPYGLYFLKYDSVQTTNVVLISFLCVQVISWVSLGKCLI